MEKHNLDKAVESLLDRLYHWAPLSASFRMLLKEKIGVQQQVAKSILLDQGAHAKRIWYSVDCIVIGYDYGRGSSEYVNRIYLPGDIFTDLGSFFHLTATKSKLLVLQGSELLYIGRENFSELRIYPEGFDLMQQLMLREHDLQVWRGWLMALRDEQKVKEFGVIFPIYQIPNHIAASFLQMTPSRFSAIKAGL